MSYPITHGGPERAYKVCKCNRCNVQTACTPHFDFYTKHGDDNGPLYCFTCLLQESGLVPKPEADLMN